MENTEHQNLKILSQFTRYQFLMKITQLLLSVSVFSLLLCNSSRLSFLDPFNFYFSTVPVQLFKHTINKNCIFLLCNGLLVFVAKLSGLIAPSSSSSSSSSKCNNHNYYIDQSVKRYDQDYYEPTLVLLEKSKLELVEKEESIVQENVVSLEERKENKILVEEKEQESEVAVDQENDEDQEDQEKEFEEKFPVQEYYQEDDDQEYEDDEYEEENGMLSTEELNKKFEEFIRKMKEEIRFEAQQQLVMVN